MIHRSRTAIAAVVILLCGVAAFALELPPRYHTRAELYQFVDSLAAARPNWVKVDSIGHSRGEMDGVLWPIYAVKISDNVNVFEDEPVSLIIMHIHAEEVIGMEASIEYMRRLVTEYHSLRNNTQIYFIPTMNPDGLEVISSGRDITWRKNGYRPPQLAECVVVEGVGEDLCGVDLNRNFELNWIYGDTLWQPAANEPFDYYRGPGPFSEPEARAIRDFALEIKPTTSIVYHSSRSGSVAERSIIAWQWGLDPGPYKFAPDSVALALWNHRYVELTQAVPGGHHFLFVWGGTHNGCLQDWFYWRIGTFQSLTESSPSDGGIHPDSALLEATITSMIPSLNWMNRRLLNLDHDAPAPLSIYTRDASTLDSISAEWRIMNTWSPVLAPRMTNEQHGRMTILPPAGQITILARKEGYANATVTTTIQPGGDPQSVVLNLVPLPHYNLTINLTDAAGAGISGNVYLDGEFPRWLQIPASGYSMQLAEGSYRLRAKADQEGSVVAWREFEHGGDRTLEISLPPSELVWSEDFSGGLANWLTGGEQYTWRADLDTTAMNFGYSACTNPEGYRERALYENNADMWLRTNATLPLAGGNIAYLEFYRRGRLDLPNDSLFVEVSTDGDNWQRAAGFADMEIPWTRTYVNLSAWIPNEVLIRFRLRSDGVLGELGMHIDNLRVYRGTDFDSVVPPAPVPYEYAITGAYPNPFNPSTTIRYEVGGRSAGQIVIFNLLGEAVRTYEISHAVAGTHTLTWNGANEAGIGAPSGIYFARLAAEGHLSTLKLLLVR